MKKNYLTLLTLIALIPCAVFSQTPTIHSAIDSTFNSDGSLAYTIDATTVANATGVTLTVTFAAQTSDLAEIYDISINRDTDARLKDRVRIAKAIPLPANGTYVFVDEFATWTADAGSPTGYTGSGAYPVGTPLFYSLSVARLPESGGNTTPKRSYPAIYLPDAPDEVVVDVLNDDMTLVTRVYPNQDDQSVILALDFSPNYDYYQQVLLAADPGNAMYPAGDKLVYYQDLLIDSDNDPAGRVDTGNPNIYWGFEGTTYYKFDVAPENIGNDGYAYVWMKGGRPGHSTVTPIPLNMGVSLSVNDVKDIAEIKMYPNPSNSLVFIKGLEGIQQVKLMDMFGKTLLSKQGTNRDSVTIDVSNVPTGMYLVALQTKDGQYIKKLIVK